MLFFSFKKGLNDQNHSFSDSHHHIKIPLIAKFPSQWADIPGFPTGVENMGDLNRCMGGVKLGRGVVEMLLKNICEGVHILVKCPAISVQIY